MVQYSTYWHNTVIFRSSLVIYYTLFGGASGRPGKKERIRLAYSCIENYLTGRSCRDALIH
jgi:hypothetical protein